MLLFAVVVIVVSLSGCSSKRNNDFSLDIDVPEDPKFDYEGYIIFQENSNGINSIKETLFQTAHYYVKQIYNSTKRGKNIWNVFDSVDAIMSLHSVGSATSYEILNSIPDDNYGAIFKNAGVSGYLDSVGTYGYGLHAQFALLADEGHNPDDLFDYYNKAFAY